MFSPWYARARRAGRADPLQHVSLNVALYTARGRRWALTERRQAALRRERHALTLGPSTLAWDGTALAIDIDEITAPFASRLRGTVRLYPSALCGTRFPLDAGGRHQWQPIVPAARVEVAFDAPSLRWSGHGYLDHNAGSVPLEDDFVGWTWARMRRDREALVLYDVVPRHGDAHALALRFDAQGAATPFAPPPGHHLPDTRWRIARSMPAEPGHTPRVLRTLEDAPFYARSIVATRLLGGPVTAIHESLSLDRFRSPWVQRLLPFRMRRDRA